MYKRTSGECFFSKVENEFYKREQRTRMKTDLLPKTALTWTTNGKRKKERPKETYGEGYLKEK